MIGHRDHRDHRDGKGMCAHAGEQLPAGLHNPCALGPGESTFSETAPRRVGKPRGTRT